MGFMDLFKKRSPAEKALEKAAKYFKKNGKCEKELAKVMQQHDTADKMKKAEFKAEFEKEKIKPKENIAKELEDKWNNCSEEEQKEAMVQAMNSFDDDDIKLLEWTAINSKDEISRESAKRRLKELKK